MEGQLVNHIEIPAGRVMVGDILLEQNKQAGGVRIESVHRYTAPNGTPIARLAGLERFGGWPYCADAIVRVRR